MSMLDSALEYARRQWCVFPCHYVLRNGSCSCGTVNCSRIGKHPLTRKGFQEATIDEEQIRNWWRGHYNIGFATGDGIVVMDVDSDPSKGKVGEESLRQILRTETLPNTLICRTGSGGLHYYFQTDQHIKNSTNRVGKDIDVRGVGGYVILPPSNHASGGHYEWLNQLPPATLPAWLMKLMMPASAIEISEEDTADVAGVKKESKPDKISKEDLIRLLKYIPAEERDTWWKVGAALKNEFGEEKGFKIWDQWSSQSPKHDPSMQQAQWQSFTDKGLSGGTIYHFAKENGFRGFETETADLEEFVEGWCYIVAIKRFYQHSTKREWDAEQFSQNYASYFSKGKASDHVLKNPNFKRYDSMTYEPNKPLIVDGMLNAWRANSLEPKEGNVEPFLEHVNYLLPEKQESELLLDFMAFQVQFPGVKIHWAMLLSGDPGTGKSYLGDVMRKMLGEHNVTMLNNEALHETYTGWQRNTQLIIVEEMMAANRRELMNKLKPMITEPWCQIREMYRPPYAQPNKFNFLFFTNHNDSIIVDKKDRRYCILASEAVPRNPKYYKGLFEWTDKNAGAILAYLKSKELNGFNAKAHAPVTRGKQELIVESMMPIDQYIHERVGIKEWPFNVDLIKSTSLVEVLRSNGMMSNPKEIGRALGRLGYCRLGKFRGCGERGIIWAVRDAELYQGLGEEELKKAIWTQYKGDMEMLLRDMPLDPLQEHRPM